MLTQEIIESILESFESREIGLAMRRGTMLADAPTVRRRINALGHDLFGRMETMPALLRAIDHDGRDLTAAPLCELVS